MPCRIGLAIARWIAQAPNGAPRVGTCWRSLEETQMRGCPWRKKPKAMLLCVLTVMITGYVGHQSLPEGRSPGHGGLDRGHRDEPLALRGRMFNGRCWATAARLS